MGTPHIQAAVGEIAERILLPGDPLRAKYIAETFLSDVRQVNDVRGILGFTGTYRGKTVSAMGTGMGIPSISIYANELMREYGVKTLVRVGTCGSMRAEIGLKDIILAIGCCTDSGFLRESFCGDYAPLADFELLNTAYEKATEKGKTVHVGLLKSSDMFYGESAPGEENWEKYGVLGVEMEGAALYTLAKKYSARALCICSVSDSLVDKTELSSDARERSLNEMLELALNTVTEY